MSDCPKKIWILAGEPSGDLIGAHLIETLRASDPAIQFRGVGGPQMQKAGLSLLFPMNDIAVMGLVEVLCHLPRLVVRLHQAKKDIVNFAPDMVITIDSPGFSFRLLRSIAALNLYRIHYVAPQVWAWRSDKFSRFKGIWDRLLCLFPFEDKLFNEKGLKASFVGHPLIETIPKEIQTQRLPAGEEGKQGQKLLLLLPGSRKGELKRLLPVFGETLRQLYQERSDVVSLIVATPSTKPYIEKQVRHWQIQPKIVSHTRDKKAAYASATFALCKSGTATTELALYGVPFVTVYKVNALTAFMARRLIHVPYVTMVNILVGAPLIPECLQEACRADNLTKILNRWLDDPKLRRHQVHTLKAIKKKLYPRQGRTPSQAAAAIVLKILHAGTDPQKRR